MWEKQLLKIVYFDEGVTTDFNCIFENRKTEERKNNVVARTMDIETKTETKVTESKKLFNFFRADAYGEAGLGNDHTLFGYDRRFNWSRKI